jgi:hypothetical protein
MPLNFGPGANSSSGYRYPVGFASVSLMCQCKSVLRTKAFKLCFDS